jgi:hypothetical protein
MRGYDSRTEALFSYVTLESYVPKSHPLRAIRAMADEALKGMDKIFDSMYSTSGKYRTDVIKHGGEVTISLVH